MDTDADRHRDSRQGAHCSLGSIGLRTKRCTCPNWALTKGNAGAEFCVQRDQFELLAQGHVPQGQTAEVYDAELLGATVRYRPGGGMSFQVSSVDVCARPYPSKV